MTPNPQNHGRGRDDEPVNPAQPLVQERGRKTVPCEMPTSGFST